MQKRYVSITVFTATLSIVTGMTAFAGSWKSDTTGRYYENDDGSRPVYAGWFTDPAEGSIYAMDPDGYVMTNATYGEYRTDDSGKRIEATEEELAKAAARKAELAARPNPAKATTAASLAAKTATAATTTTRAAYQAEMLVLMEKIMNATKAARADTSILAFTDNDNTQTIYGFRNPDQYRFISVALWKTATKGIAGYKDNAAELTYHYDAAVGDATIYDNTFYQLVIAAIGETEGAAVMDYINSERQNGNTEFARSSKTDAGNYYTLTYKDNLAKLAITCSEIVPKETTDEVAGEDTAE